MSRLPIGYVVRLAVVSKVRKTFIECVYTDRQGEDPVQCPIPHPYANSSGGGIFIGIEKDTRVLIALAPGERPHIVGIVPNRGLYFDQGGVPDSPVYSSEYPQVENGEIHLKSSVGSVVKLLKNGNIALDANIGDSSNDIELSYVSKALFMRTDNVYRFTEAGREIEGIIKRDKSEDEDAEDTNSLNFLTGEIYSNILSDVGRSPEDDVNYRTHSLSKSVTRNPSLVEKRSIVYEYADSFGVRGLTTEANSMIEITERNLSDAANLTQISPSSRENRRTDVLDLNLRNYNHLIEKVEGTVVDIYGNILDINRNIIRVPEVEDLDTATQYKASHGLMRLYSYLRRSIKYHMEINSRKDIADIEPSVSNPGHNAKNHSRWSLDVDGEGLTKINIPASSETGNIPVLSRYVVSRNSEQGSENEGQFRDAQGRDVRIIKFGADGQEIDNSEYAPITTNDQTSTTAGTAYHDLLNIAPSIFSSGGKLRNPDPGSGASVVPPMTDKINNKIPVLQSGLYHISNNPDANAGGRSVHANLDGSMEMSVGADTADRKSLVLDLAGGVVSHYGRDRNGRSIIQQLDGDVIIQVGGNGLEDPRFDDTSDRPGRVEIHLNRPGSSATNQKIIIDENGITISVVGNGIFKTTGDLTISAGGKLLLNGESIYAYGSVDDSVDGARAVRGAGERLISRKGRHM